MKLILKKITALISLLRPKHWIKNSFVVAPLIFSGLFVEEYAIYKILLAVILFSLASSATYILNDIYDINDDRKHPIKSKKRPLANGSISINTAFIIMFLIYLILGIFWFYVSNVVNIIILYLILNFTYTFALKKQPVVDIFVIAIGFLLRVYTGIEALDISLSVWMFVATLCLALYLASIKRRQELICVGKKSREVLHQYSFDLIDKYAEMSAICTFVFYSLFVVQIKPNLMFTIPFVLFGIFRYWFIVDKLNLGESPTDTVFEDKILLLTIFLWLFLTIFLLMRS